MNSAQHTADRQIVTRPPREQSATSRRVGYLVAIVINTVLLYLINRSPGWEAVSFLSDDTPRVLGLVNASIVAGIVANCVYTLWDPRWLRALGDIVTVSIGLAALVALWNVFPVDFGSASDPWELVARWVIGVGIAGSSIGIIVALVQLGRALISPTQPDRR
ncbi:MAG: hypothetical protein WCG47_12825 [Dermatophilaceae bacterium]